MNKLAKSKNNHYKFFIVKYVIMWKAMNCAALLWAHQDWSNRLCDIILSVIPHINYVSYFTINKAFRFHFSALNSSKLLVCETDYWLNISCFLDSIPIANKTENITYHLDFYMNNEKKVFIYKYSAPFP